MPGPKIQSELEKQGTMEASDYTTTFGGIHIFKH